jgi:hypothetical protein
MRQVRAGRRGTGEAEWRAGLAGANSPVLEMQGRRGQSEVAVEGGRSTKRRGRVEEGRAREQKRLDRYQLSLLAVAALLINEFADTYFSFVFSARLRDIVKKTSSRENERTPMWLPSSWSILDLAILQPVCPMLPHGCVLHSKLIHRQILRFCDVYIPDFSSTRSGSPLTPRTTFSTAAHTMPSQVRHVTATC